MLFVFELEISEAFPPIEAGSDPALEEITHFRYRFFAGKVVIRSPVY
jgi:hypothetical protein